MENIFIFNAWIGSILLAICGLPLAWRSYKDGHSHGVDFLFLIVWGLGEIFTLSYVLYKWDLPLILNYSLNLIFIGIVFYYKIKPREIDE